MRLYHRTVHIFFVLLYLATITRGQGLVVEPPDIIIIHGRVYTEDPTQPWAKAVAIRGAKITAVGEDATIEKMRGIGTKVINAGGRLVLPGLVDCHVRFFEGSIRLTGVDSKATRAEQLLALRAGMQLANQEGFTGMQEAGGESPFVDFVDEMRRRGDLKLRFYVSYILTPPELRRSNIETIASARKKFHDEWVDVGGVEIILDSIADSNDQSTFRSDKDEGPFGGKLLWEPTNYRLAVLEADNHGLQISTDTVGTAGLVAALDAYEDLEQHHHKRERRLRIQGLNMVSAAQIERFRKLAVIAILNPRFSNLEPGAPEVERTDHPLEDDAGSSIAKRILDSGGHLAFGSAWPRFALNPWETIQSVVIGGAAASGPEGRDDLLHLTVAQAVEAYTIGAAFAGHREKMEGSIEVGKLADLIIVSKNIFEVNVHNISQTKVLTTIVGGHVVYQATNQSTVMPN